MHAAYTTICAMRSGKSSGQSANGAQPVRLPTKPPRNPKTNDTTKAISSRANQYFAHALRHADSGGTSTCSDVSAFTEFLKKENEGLAKLSGLTICALVCRAPATNPLPQTWQVTYLPNSRCSISYSVPQCGQLMFICNLSFPRLPYRTPPLWRGKGKRRTHIVRNFQTKIENASSPH